MVTAAAGRRDTHAQNNRQTMSIGAVLALLRPDFPDVSISKIRFLEDQGLVEPQRTPAGYRKFGHQDVERLRYVLGVQRDHYLPLRVIREHLDALDRGLEPPVTRGGPGSPRLVELTDRSSGTDPHEGQGGAGRRFSREQLLAAAEVDDTVLRDLESHGLVAVRPGGFYDVDAVLVTRTARELGVFGIEPRHLRAFRSAADREAGLVEQVVSPLRRQRGPEAAAHAEEVTREVSQLCVRLHATLVKAALERGGN
ncbi:MAG TPA: MerR family transcriptional regulator [Kineosporiaceae bacterium]|nr:MerR family transcriptional regulator [Kineosporiaceae bacterium]